MWYYKHVEGNKVRIKNKKRKVVVPISRPINTELRAKVLNYLKEACLKEGGPVSPPLQDIAEAVGEKRSSAEKILRMINMLEKSGSIKVYRFEGSIPNKYEFINNASHDYMAEVKQKNNASIESVVSNLNRAMQDVMDTYASAIKENQNNLAELIMLRDMVKGLEFIGTGVNGEPMFKAQRGNALAMYIDKIKNQSTTEEADNEDED